MVRILITMVLLLGATLPVLKADQNLLDLLHSAAGREPVESYSEGDELLVKKIDGRNLGAVMVRQVLNINPDVMAEVVLDIPNYPRFLTANAGFQSRLVNQTDHWRDGYQYLAVPVLSDRHYFFRMFPVEMHGSEEAARVDWLLVPESVEYEMAETQSGENPVYLTYGAGSWLPQPLSDGLAEVSYRLYMDPGGKIPSFLVDRINAVSVVNLFRDAVKEMQRRPKEL